MLNQSAEYSIQIGNSEKQSKGVGTKLILEHAFNNLLNFRTQIPLNS